jgi:hypothetical protein
VYLTDGNDNASFTPWWLRHRHLLPAFTGLGTFLLGMGLSFLYLCQQ